MTPEDSSESLDGKDLFSPPWYFRNGHVQTIASRYLYSPFIKRRLRASTVSTTGEVLLDDGDRLIYQDDTPRDWQSADRVSLLLHGLGGTHASPYMSRVARLLNRYSVRTFRLDWRGCGAGGGLARYPYHSGRSADLAAAIAEIHRQCPGSPLSVIGFSLGGNVTLKLLGEHQDQAEQVPNVDRAVAVCPPIDLNFTVTSMQKGLARLYDRYFCRSCTRDVDSRKQQRPDAIIPESWFVQRPRTLYEFDDTFTAPVCGFQSAADYYARSSAKQFLTSIRTPTLIIAAQDDPLIPFEQFRTEYSSTTKLLAPRHGGHLGFCMPGGMGWLDRQIANWVTNSLSS
ncbi:YheT family hydrolase [Planctomicrobium sp. SH664]|uniref:YheT family hydrolase n=1 Tax=Planctomicrobium sp. SH664 TaxID=3448125 RepID=UPI003F5C9408